MSKRHRRHSTASKREIVEAHFNGETMRGLGQRYDVCRTLIPIWVEKYERGEFDGEPRWPPPVRGPWRTSSSRN